MPGLKTLKIPNAFKTYTLKLRRVKFAQPNYINMSQLMNDDQIETAIGKLFHTFTYSELYLCCYYKGNHGDLGYSHVTSLYFHFGIF